MASYHWRQRAFIDLHSGVGLSNAFFIVTITASSLPGFEVGAPGCFPDSTGFVVARVIFLYGLFTMI